MANKGAGRPRRYPKGGRVKTTTEFSLDLDRAIEVLRDSRSRTDYLETVLRQVPEIAREIESQRVSENV